MYKFIAWQHYSNGFSSVSTIVRLSSISNRYDMILYFKTNVHRRPSLQARVPTTRSGADYGEWGTGTCHLCIPLLRWISHHWVRGNHWRRFFSWLKRREHFCITRTAQEKSNYSAIFIFLLWKKDKYVVRARYNLGL